MSALPTFVDNATVTADLLKSVRSALKGSATSKKLTLFFYSVSVAGWDSVSKSAAGWLVAQKNREIVAYVGTDHALTDPEALRAMRDDGVNVRMMVNYDGIFHPKVFVLEGPAGISLWSGSNNLTHAGLQRNIEFALLLEAAKLPTPFQTWAAHVHAGSQALDESLLKSYESERTRYAVGRPPNFTWSKRKKPVVTKTAKPNAPIPPASGALVMEVMPRETGAGGKQIQPPMATLGPFFGLPHTHDSKKVVLTRTGTGASRDLTLTRMKNSTARLVVNDLDYGDRPCFLIFETQADGSFEYDIVSEAVQPLRYESLTKIATKQASEKSRRWGYAS